MVKLKKSKLLDCITFFDNNFMFQIRYNVLVNYVDYFVVCESLFDHKGNAKKQFYLEDEYKKEKIKYFLLETPFPQKTNPWENQAIQREFLLDLQILLIKQIIYFFQILMKFLNQKF